MLPLLFEEPAPAKHSVRNSNVTPIGREPCSDHCGISRGCSDIRYEILAIPQQLISVPGLYSTPRRIKAPLVTPRNVLFVTTEEHIYAVASPRKESP
jgi:hypothetical protein